MRPCTHRLFPCHLEYRDSLGNFSAILPTAYKNYIFKHFRITHCRIIKLDISNIWSSLKEASGQWPALSSPAFQYSDIPCSKPQRMNSQSEEVAAALWMFRVYSIAKLLLQHAWIVAVEKEENKILLCNYRNYLSYTEYIDGLQWELRKPVCWVFKALIRSAILVFFFFKLYIIFVYFEYLCTISCKMVSPEVVTPQEKQHLESLPVCTTPVGLTKNYFLAKRYNIYCASLVLLMHI